MTDIKDLTFSELENEISGLGESSYRARQIFSWLYRAGSHEFNEMGNIPKVLKDKLNKDYYVSGLEVSEHLKSADGTEKILFKLQDGRFTETVLIPAKRRKTLCLSTQVGCKFACPFCASGSNGYTRNLTSSEIVNQALYFQRDLKHKITNYVFMGMGEPLDNYENVAKSIAILNDAKGMNIGARRITLSTCGIIPGIEKLKCLGLQVNLSVSLHAGNDELRNKLMPVNKRYPLKKLIKACEDFRDKTGRMTTLEYILIRGVNDSPQDSDDLAAIAKRLRAKVNLIRYSAVPNSSFQSPEEKDRIVFMKRLVSGGVSATLRKSKGKDIQAACGQLAGGLSQSGG